MGKNNPWYKSLVMYFRTLLYDIFDTKHDDKISQETKSNHKESISPKVEIHKRIAIVFSVFVSFGLALLIYIAFVQVYFRQSTNLKEFSESVFIKSRLTQIIVFGAILLIVLLIRKPLDFLFNIFFLRETNEDNLKQRITLLEDIFSKNSPKDLQQRLDEKINKTVLDVLLLKQNNDKETELDLSAKEIYYVWNDVSNLKNRIDNEISRLIRYSRQNLMIGTVFALIGLFWLLYSFRDISIKNGNDFILQYIQKISFVILLEIFAFFFLRLYKYSLGEIKYFQNEKTNIEAKMIALKISMSQNNTEVMNSVLKEMGKTERNLVIKKGNVNVIETGRDDSISQITELLKTLNINRS